MVKGIKGELTSFSKITYHSSQRIESVKIRVDKIRFLCNYSSCKFQSKLDIS